jgi:hypothetical protein
MFPSGIRSGERCLMTNDFIRVPKTRLPKNAVHSNDRPQPLKSLTSQTVLIAAVSADTDWVGKSNPVFASFTTSAIPPFPYAITGLPQA